MLPCQVEKLRGLKKRLFTARDASNVDCIERVRSAGPVLSLALFNGHEKKKRNKALCRRAGCGRAYASPGLHQDCSAPVRIRGLTPSALSPRLQRVRPYRETCIYQGVQRRVRLTACSSFRPADAPASFIASSCRASAISLSFAIAVDNVASCCSRSSRDKRPSSASSVAEAAALARSKCSAVSRAALKQERGQYRRCSGLHSVLGVGAEGERR